MATITATKELNKLGRLAFQTGCPQDSLSRFLTGGYVPQPKGLQFHAYAREADDPGGPDVIAMGGTRGQAKSHAIYAQAVLDDMHRVDGLKFLYLRKIQKKAGESLEDLRTKVLKYTGHEFKNNVLRLPNGSRMIMGGFRSEAEIDTYLGIEYDAAVIEDATTLSQTKINAIRGSVRSSRDDWRARLYMSANPGGVGHVWFRRLLVDPWIFGEETTTRFVHVTMGDNAYIRREYEAYLKSLTGWMYQAWCLGDFTISAGQYFSTWNAQVHVIDPFPLPQHWRYWLGFDYGFTHFTVAVLFAQDGDGMTYIVDEHGAQKWIVERHAEAIHAMLERNGVQPARLDGIFAGADVFAARRGDSVTIADEYAAHGLNFSQAQMARQNGAAEGLRLLGDIDNGIEPRLKVFNRCHRLIETMPEMQHNPNRPEDVLKIDADDEGRGGDDYYDAARYGWMEAKNTTGWGPNPLAGYRG